MPGTLSFLYGQLLQTPALPTTLLTNTTIIVTGANSGLGLDACKHLLRLQCGTIIMAVRNVEKGEAAKQEVLKSSSKTEKAATTIEVWPLDYTSYGSVAAFTDRVAMTLPRLDAVILNAGISLTEFSSAEGLETTLTVNVTSTFLLALLLLPALRATALKYKVLPHIAIVGSAVHFWANTKALTAIPPDQNMLKSLSVRETAVMKDRYFLSKLIVMLCVRQLAKHLSASSSLQTGAKPLVVVNNIAPGYCVTSLFRHQDTAAVRASLKVIGRSSEEGSRTLVWGVLAGKDSNGSYMSEGLVKKASNWVLSQEGERIGERLWQEILEVAEGVRPGVGKEI